MALLSLNNVETSYGPISALQSVSLEVKEGSVVAILGANGAGKTTVLKSISGVMDPSRGTITFAGQEIHRKEPDRIMAQGIAHVPEGRELFPQLTVRENLRMGAYLRRDRQEIQRDLQLVYKYFPILKERHATLAGKLSGGEQQMVAIGRALMARPRLLLLDEPSLGLSPILVRNIFTIIERIRSQHGVTILLVEQNAQMALSLADYGYVLEVGRVVLEGPADRLLNHSDIQEYYLGTGHESQFHSGRKWKRRKQWR